MCPGDRRVRSCALVPFQCALGVLDVWVRSIPVRLGGRRVRSGAFGRIPSVLRVRVRPRGHTVHSVAFGLFPCALGVIGRIRSIRVDSKLRSVAFVHSRAPWVS